MWMSNGHHMNPFNINMDVKWTCLCTFDIHLTSMLVSNGHFISMSNGQSLMHLTWIIRVIWANVLLTSQIWHFMSFQMRTMSSWHLHVIWNVIWTPLLYLCNPPQTLCSEKGTFIHKVKKLKENIWKHTHENQKNGWKCKPKFSCKNRRFELRDCYCTTALQTKWGCFKRVAALPLLPAVRVTVLAPHPTWTPLSYSSKVILHPKYNAWPVSHISHRSGTPIQMPQSCQRV
jgi:hypothetical protein